MLLCIVTSICTDNHSKVLGLQTVEWRMQVKHPFIFRKHWAYWINPTVAMCIAFLNQSTDFAAHACVCCSCPVICDTHCDCTFSTFRCVLFLGKLCYFILSQILLLTRHYFTKVVLLIELQSGYWWWSIPNVSWQSLERRFFFSMRVLGFCWN